MTREEAIKQLELYRACMLADWADVEAYNMAIEALNQQKEGHWKIIPFGNNHGEYRPKEYVCSECGWKIDLCRGLQQDTGHRLFCEHCGAKMESEVEDAT